LSPDEKTLAVAASTGVYLFNFLTFQQESFIDLPLNFGYMAIAFSPDGKLLAIGATDKIVLWNIELDRRGRTIPHRIADYAISQIAFSPKGDTLVASSRGGYGYCDATGGNFAIYNIDGVLLYDVYYCLASHPNYFGYDINGDVYFYGVYPKFGKLALQVVDSSSGELLRMINLDVTPGSGYIGVNPDGSMIYHSYYRQGYNMTRIIDADTLETVNEVDGHLHSLGTNNPDRWLHEMNKELIVRDADFNTVCSFGEGLHYNNSFGISGQYIVKQGFGYAMIEIWDTNDCSLVKEMFWPLAQQSLEYSPDGKFIVASSLGTTHLWSSESGLHESSFSWDKFVKSGGISYSQANPVNNDGTIMVTIYNHSDLIIVWDIGSGKVKNVIKTKYNDFRLGVIDPNDVLIALDYYGLHRWDLNLGTKIEGFRFPKDANDASISLNGETFAFVIDGAIEIVNTRDFEVVREIPLSGNIVDFECSIDCKKLLVYTDDFYEIWDVDTGKLMGKLFEYPPIGIPDEKEGYGQFGFSPDGRILMATLGKYSPGNSTFRFWDTSTGKILRDIDLNFHVHSWSFNPDGSQISLLVNCLIYMMEVVDIEK